MQKRQGARRYQVGRPTPMACLELLLYLVKRPAPLWLGVSGRYQDPAPEASKESIDQISGYNVCLTSI